MTSASDAWKRSVLKSSPEQSSASSPTSMIPWSEPPWHNNVLASPYYKPSHVELRKHIRKYVDEKIIPNQLAWEAAGKAPKEAALDYARSGIPFADVPLSYRPANVRTIAGIPFEELDAFHALILMDEMSRVFTGVMIALGGASGIGIPPIIHYGTDEQKQRWLPGLFTWETSFCLGITEPTAGSDVSNIKTTAKKTPDGQYYIVNGFKKWITGAPYASHMTTAVRTGGPGISGISLLVVPLSTAGISIRRIANSGQAAGGASFITLSDVLVPIDHLLGRENGGFPLIMTNFNKERFALAVGCNRMARTCLSTSLSYAQDRETFGKPLISNQLIRFKITEMARRIDSHWAWLEQIAYHVTQYGWQNADLAGPIALCKVSGGHILEFAAREAQQILGGNGYMRSGPGAVVEQISRDLRMMVVGGGSEEILGELAFREEMKRAGKADAAKL